MITIIMTLKWYQIQMTDLNPDQYGLAVKTYMTVMINAMMILRSNGHNTRIFRFDSNELINAYKIYQITFRQSR